MKWSLDLLGSGCGPCSCSADRSTPHNRFRYSHPKHTTVLGGNCRTGGGAHLTGPASSRRVAMPAAEAVAPTQACFIDKSDCSGLLDPAYFVE